jgi:hypothetical protein
MLATRRLGVGLALAVCLAGSSALAAPSALAVTSAPGPVAAPAATFHTWRAAQHAASFKLLRPGRTYKLKLLGAIHLEHCHVTGETRKRVVDATYGQAGHALLGIEQNNSGAPCGNGEVAKSLGTVKIHGVTAHLAGLCGMTGLPSCHSKKIFLFLTWRHHGIYYQAVSDNEARATLVGFARALHRVS